MVRSGYWVAFLLLAILVIDPGYASVVPAPSGRGKLALQEDDVLLYLDQGPLRGARLISREGRDYLAFLGIPYAEPPVGSLRFQAPVKAEPWEGTLNATTLTPQCIQKDKYNPLPVSKGSEDCLHLNVYTPKKLEDMGNASLPVMFYIHGGGPTGNASRYRGDYLMDEDVIFITIHYRLGALGNLNTFDSSARGNQGVRDQLMALQWVQENIDKFGGDKGKVTIFGNSFGGMAVSTLLVSPLSAGLFSQAIAQSGVAINAALIGGDTRATAFELGQNLGCAPGSNSSAELVECLRNVDAGELALCSYEMPFVTSVDPPSENGDDVLLPDTPLNLYRSGQIHNVPAIFGVNSGEGLAGSLVLLLSPESTDDINENWTEVVATALGLRETASEPEEIADAVREAYFGDTLVSRETEGPLTDMFSDRQFVHSAAVVANLQQANNEAGKNVYLYYFDREVPRKYSQALEDLYQPDYFLGAAHADELQLLFPYDTYPYISTDSEYFNISRALVKLWTSFAQSGKPSGAGNEWLPIDSNNKASQWFQIHDAPVMTDSLDPRMAFWDAYDLNELYAVSPDAPTKDQAKLFKKLVSMDLL